LTGGTVLIAWKAMPEVSQVEVALSAPPWAPGASAPASADHQAAMVEARRIALATGRTVSTVDILLGMLRAGGAAARLLAERGIPTTTLEVLATKTRPEPGLNEAAVAAASHDIALGLAAVQTTSLHLLLALLRSGGAATETLRLAGIEPAKLRGIVMRALTGHGAPIERKVSRSSASPTASESGFRVGDRGRARVPAPERGVPGAAGRAGAGSRAGRADCEQ
jgi:hypothetical protein